MTVQEVCFLAVGLGFLAAKSDHFLYGRVLLFTGRRSGLEITAGQRTMSGQNRALSEQIRG